MMDVDLTRFGLAIVPDPPDPCDPEQRDGLIDTNGSVRLTPEVARALASVGNVCHVVLRFDAFFTEEWPRTDESGVVKAWDMKFRGTGKVDCDISKIEASKLECQSDN